MLSVLAPTLVAAACMAAIWLAVRPPEARTREARALVFLSLAVLPVIAAFAGFNQHMSRAQSTEFCLSCHVMSGFGQSLKIDDPSYIPAKHYQNNFVPREKACYTCHTDYTMFGGLKAKMRGMRHLWIQYVQTPPAPAAIRLYVPYNNRECLHCHLGARKFEEAGAHVKRTGLLQRVKANQESCISSGCHEFVHDVGNLKDMTFWKEAAR